MIQDLVQVKVVHEQTLVLDKKSCTAKIFNALQKTFHLYGGNLQFEYQSSDSELLSAGTEEELNIFTELVSHHAVENPTEETFLLGSSSGYSSKLSRINFNVASRARY